MGVVYLAEQKSPQRVVALKFMTGADSRYVRRFLREMELSSRLDHPNIVKSYMSGLMGKIPYLAMAFIDGQPLNVYAKTVGLSLHAKLRIMKILAQALHHAHRQGIVHRDIKPDNIIVTDSGIPFITDFGIARSMRVYDKSLTRTGDIIGTPQYMAPEQAQGDRQLDGRADVYSLGATFYEIITGHPLFLAESPMEALYKIANYVPVMPRQHDPNLPVAVDAILLKSLEKNKHKRYRHAGELAGEIENYLSGKSTSLSSRHTMQKFRRQLAINKKRMAIVGVILLLILPFPFIYLLVQKTSSPKTISAAQKIAYYARQSRTNPSVDIYREYIALLEKLGKYPQAIERCKAALQWAERHRRTAIAEFTVLQIRLLLRYDHYYRATALCRKFYKKRPGNVPEITLMWAQAAFGAKHYEGIAPILQRVADWTELDPELQKNYCFYMGAGAFHNFLATVSRLDYLEKVQNKFFANNKKLQNVILWLQRTKMPAEKTSAYLAYVYTCLADWTRAQQYLKLANTEKSPQVIVEEAWGIYQYCHKKDFHKAVQHFSKCIELRTWESVYYHFRAQARLQQKKIALTAIMNDCTKALALLPANLTPTDILLTAMLKDFDFDQFYEIYSIIFTYMNRSKEKIELQLWQPEYQKLAKSCLPRSGNKNWPPDRIEDFVKMGIETKLPAVFQVAKDILGSIWYRDEVIQSLEQAAKRKSLPKLQRIEEIQELIRRKRLKRRLALFIVGRDVSVCRRVTDDDINRLKEMLVDSAEPTLLRYWAAQMLMRSHKTSSFQILKKGCGAEDEIMRCLCQATLAKNGFPVVTAVSVPNQADPQVRSITLHHLGKKLSVADCMPFLNDSHAKVKVAAARAILMHKPNSSRITEDAIKVLTSFFTSSAPEEIRAYSHRWLWTTATKFIDIKGLTTAVVKDPSPLVRRICAGVFSKLTQSSTALSKTKLRKIQRCLPRALTSETDPAIRFHLLFSLLNTGVSKDVLQRIMSPHETFSNRIIPLNIFMTNSFENADGADAYIEFAMSLINKEIDPLQDPDIRFRSLYIFLLGHIGQDSTIRKNSFFLSYINRQLGNILQSPDVHDENRTMAAYAAIMLPYTNQLRRMLEQQLAREQAPRVQKVLRSTLVHLYAQKSNKFAHQLQKLYAIDKKAAAYGHYHFFAKWYRSQVDDRLFDGTTAWGRNEKYMRHLEEVIYAIRRTAHESMVGIIKGPERTEKLIKKMLQTIPQKYSNLRKLAKTGREILQNKRKVSIHDLPVFHCHTVWRIFTLIQHLRKARSLDPTNPKYHFETALLLESVGEWHKAIEMLQQMDIYTNRPLYQFLSARLYLKLGSIQRAQHYLQELDKKNITGYTVCGLQGKIYQAQDKHQSAIDSFTRQHIIAPYLPAPLIFRGNSYLSLGNRKLAEIDYQNARKLLQSELEYNKSRYKGTVYRVYRRMHIAKAYGHYYFGMARLAAREKKYAKAMKYCKDGIESFTRQFANCSDSPFYRENLARYEEFRILLNHPFIRSMPYRIIGLTYYRAK